MVTRGKKRISLRRYIVPLGIVCCLFFVGMSSAKMIDVSPPISRSSEVYVASWSVDVSSADSDNMTLDAGKNAQTYSLTVTNTSEVVSAYGIKVSNIPAGVKIGLDITSDSDLVVPVSSEVIFTNTGGDLGYAAPNNVRTHTLTLAAEATANTTQSSVDMTIEVQFSQKDPQL